MSGISSSFSLLSRADGSCSKLFKVVLCFRYMSGCSNQEFLVMSMNLFNCQYLLITYRLAFFADIIPYFLHMQMETKSCLFLATPIGRKCSYINFLQFQKFLFLSCVYLCRRSVWKIPVLMWKCMFIFIIYENH